MKKEEVLKRLHNNGCRITKQREILIDIILTGTCTTCKEIHYLASKQDTGIGMATVYRMVRALEEVGALKRENTHLVDEEDYIEAKECIIKLEDDNLLIIGEMELKHLIEAGMQASGYPRNQNVKQLFVKHNGDESF